MATTCFFEEEIKDKGNGKSISLEFGRSSYWGEQSLYITVYDQTVIVDRETAKRIVDAMANVGNYLNLEDRQ